jgi:fusion and transport protein UGO1
LGDADFLPMAQRYHVLLPFAIQYFAHLSTGVLLSPLELVQTRFLHYTKGRLIVQTCRKKKYKSSLHCLRTILKEEYPTNWFGILLESNLFIPTLAHHSLKPLFNHGTPLIVDRVFGITQDDSPVSFILCELVISVIELIVMMPLETVRRRLQVQKHSAIVSSNEHEETIVGISPIAYANSWDCIYRILGQEGSNRMRMKGLYRGFKIRLFTNLFVAAAQILTIQD